MAFATNLFPASATISPSADPSAKILIDAIAFQLPTSGIARLWLNLLQIWATTPFAKQIVILDRNNTAPKIPGLTYRTIPAFYYDTAERDRRQLQEVCDQEQADLFISTYYTTPITTPSVFMAYDMIPEVLGQNLDHPMWREKHHGIREAAAYLSISQSTARHLIHFFPTITPADITVAYCGVDPGFQPADPSEIQSFLSRYQIQKPYFLFIGDRYGWQGYKNAILLIQAIANWPNKFDVELLFVGGQPELEPEFHPYLEGINVHVLRLTDSDLRLAYAGATALVYPSKYEGFGLPLLEAMACGCPVITCPNASIPEVAGTAALYVADDDPDQLTAALSHIQQPAIRDGLIAAGYQQIRQFSWQQMADTVRDTLLQQAAEAIALPDFTDLQQIITMGLQQYFEHHCDPAYLTDFYPARHQVATAWLRLPISQLQRAYRGTLGQIHRLLVNTIVPDRTAADRQLIQTCLDAIAQPSADSPSTIAQLLALMAYLRGYELPLSISTALPEHLPPWLLPDYWQFLFQPPGCFWHLGDGERYHAHLSQWTNLIHQHLCGDLDPMTAERDRWQTAAFTLTQTADFMPLYFAQQSHPQPWVQRAQLIEQILTEAGHPLNWTFPEPAGDRPPLRMGILAGDFNPRAETFITLPMYQHRDRNQLQVILYSLDPYDHPLAQHCVQLADAAVELSHDLAASVAQIRQDQLDLLFIVPNVTARMHQIVLLSCHRLARVQLMGMNFPVTSGMTHTDYYLSSQLGNPNWDIQRHYAEQVLQLPGAAQCFDFATEGELAATVTGDRTEFAIAADTVVFLSGANFYKITPELEATWAEIIAAVPNSVLVLYPFNPNWSGYYPRATFINRLTTCFACAGLDSSRFRVLPPAISRADVLRYVQLADVYLDAYPFSGMTSLIDPLELGIPPVVMELDTPVSLARGAAFLRELDLPDLIVNSEADYVQLAIALGTAPTLRQQFSDRINQGMARSPSFVNSERYADHVMPLLEQLVEQHPLRSILQALRGRVQNLIAFPDWQQPEDDLFCQLVELFQFILTQSDLDQTTVLIETTGLDANTIEEIFSSILMHLALETGLDVESDCAAILPVGNLSATQWQTVRPYLTGWIPLPTNGAGAAIADGLPPQSIEIN